METVSVSSIESDILEEEEGDVVDNLPDILVRQPRRMAPNFSSVRTSRRRTSAPALYHADTEPLLWDRSFQRRQSVTLPEDVEQILPNKDVTAESLGLKPYKRRFYILFLVLWVTFCSGALISTFPAIAHSTQQVYEFTDGEVALLNNWASIGFVIGFFLMMWIVDHRGVRFATILTIIFLFIGAGTRCFVIFDRHLARWLFHVGNFFIGFSTTYLNIAPATLSAIWFPVNERTTATALTSIGALLGSAASGIVGPYVITEDIIKNCTNTTNSSLMQEHTSCERHPNDTKHIRNTQFHEFEIYLGAQTTFTALALVFILVYFPARPPTPPSLSASVQKLQFRHGLLVILKMKDFLLLCIATACPYGVYLAWLALLDINLKDLDIVQKEVGWLIGANLLSGVVLSVIIGRVADCCRRKLKWFMLIDVMLAILSLTWFSLQRYGFIWSSSITIYAAVILIGIAANSITPIVYEALLEMTHPVSEGITLGAMALFLNVTSLIILMLPMVPKVGAHWLNWCLLASYVIAMPLLCLYKQRYNRLMLDDLANTQTNDGVSERFEPSDAVNY
ncbi:solute carrier family 49 member 4 homolog [Lineus longissimus]|uniref:solute carrier family 49 member 4 homolog n=1 Tax=Lineus longissimus TaxID=88925 RepID=UPI00315D7CC4